jgi:hypothetical protein
VCNKAFWQAVWLIVLVVLAIATSSLMAASLTMFLTDLGCGYITTCDQNSPVFNPKLLIPAAIFFVVTLALLLLIAKQRKKYFGSSAAMILHGKGATRKIVIMGLSYVSEIEKALNTDSGKVDPAKVVDENPELQSLIELGFPKTSLSIREMIDAKMLGENPDKKRWIATEGNCGIDWPWIQNLRALRDHIEKDKLEYVFVVPSYQTIDQAMVFKIFLERLLAKILKKEIIVEIGLPANYDNFEDVRNALLGTMRTARSKRSKKDGNRFSDSDICIDATSGKATFSIGAALVTLNHDTLYSYVTTVQSPPSQDGGKLLAYDATVDLAAFIQEV